MKNFRRHNFKKLKIWMMGINLANDIFDLVRTFPDSEKYGLTIQMNRCTISIPSNIAEGSSRTDKAFRHFLDIALGSSFELQTQILLANLKGHISSETTRELENKIEQLQRATMEFQNGLNS